MATLKLDENQDIAIENNAPVLISGQDEVRQRMLCRLKTFLTEWFLDTTVGVPWLQVIFDKASQETIAAHIKSTIINTPGVIELRSYRQSIDGATRTLIVSFGVLSTDGEIIVENEDLTP